MAKSKKVQPLMKWFFIYKNTIVETSKYERAGNNVLNLELIKKRAIILGGLSEMNKILEGARVECWQSADLIWEDKHYGQWIKVLVEYYDGFKIIGKEQKYNTQHGDAIALTCEFEKANTVAKYDSEWNKHPEWEQMEHTELELSVQYKLVGHNVEPTQTILIPDNLHSLYKE